MKAYFICGSCGRQAKTECEGTIRCPHCNSTKMKSLVISGRQPEWFKETQQEDL